MRKKPPVKLRRCPVDGCFNLVVRGQLMCRECWPKVPRTLQQRVWAEKEVVDRIHSMTAEYRDAIRAALQSTKDLQPRLPYKD